MIDRKLTAVAISPDPHLQSNVGKRTEQIAGRIIDLRTNVTETLFARKGQFEFIAQAQKVSIEHSQAFVDASDLDVGTN